MELTIDGLILNEENNNEQENEEAEPNNDEEYNANDHQNNQENLNDLEDFEEDLHPNEMDNQDNNHLITNSLEELNSQLKESAGNNNNINQSSKLITLKYVSVCQCCKLNFNSQSNLPYLLQCGHFFCKECILKKFFDKKTKVIVCPEDGAVAKSLSELKVLQNLIIENEGNPTRDNFRYEENAGESENSNVILFNKYRPAKLTQSRSSPTS